MSENTGEGRIIVITGAGASVPLGLKTMRSFLGALQRDEAGHPVVDGMPAGITASSYERSALNSLLRGMAFCTDDDSWDLESVYDRVQSYIEFCTTCTNDRNLRRLICPSWLVTYSKRFCSHVALLATAEAAQRHLNRMILTHFGNVDSDLAYDAYGDLVLWLRQRNGAPLSLFTTNYDLTFERLQEAGCRKQSWADSAIITGLRLHEDGFRMVWDPSVYQSVSALTQLVVYRLHGCSHWFRNNDGQIVALPHSVADSVDLRPMVIFPSRLKTDLLHGGPFVYVYRALRRAVIQAKVCLVIGHSFGDEGIREAIASAPPSTRFIVVDPELPSDEIRRALEYHKFHLISKPFGERDTVGVIRDAVETFLSSRETAAIKT